MKHRGLLIILLLLATSSLMSASITEIRKDFFRRTTNLAATPIMSAPTGNASYLISVYESTTSCAVLPILRWTDENGVAQALIGTVGPGGDNCYLSLLVNIRVQGKTRPTIETHGPSGSVYSLYVSGLGFWPSGTEGQSGLSEVTGSLPTKSQVYALAAYEPAASSTALLITYSTGYSGQDIPYIIWTDENGTNSVQVPVGISALLPVRIAGGTKLWIHTYPGDTTWYGLIIFGPPAKGPGPFDDYEANLLDWTAATYPNWEPVFTAGSAGANVLLLSNMTQLANNGTVNEGLQVGWTGQKSVPCAASLTANPSGLPASCMSPFFMGSNSTMQLRTYNTPGSPWGPSPTYSAEVDVLQF